MTRKSEKVLIAQLNLSACHAIDAAGSYLLPKAPQRAAVSASMDQPRSRSRGGKRCKARCSILGMFLLSVRRAARGRGRAPQASEAAKYQKPVIHVLHGEPAAKCL